MSAHVNELGVTTTPKFTHDCDQCVFLGHVLEHDVYFCAREPTLIARWGSAGWEYHSGLVFMRSFGEEKELRESRWLRACALACIYHTCRETVPRMRTVSHGREPVDGLPRKVLLEVYDIHAEALDHEAP